MDWNLGKSLALFCDIVLPLTREWIEIWAYPLSATSAGSAFSLLRGSGLKSLCVAVIYLSTMFSLLRGSGLKSPLPCISASTSGSPSYEGVDWNVLLRRHGLCTKSEFSLLRGSGLKCFSSGRPLRAASVLPLTREWIEIFWSLCFARILYTVLPLTREWIEIHLQRVHITPWKRSPSYEGVDWNISHCMPPKKLLTVLPLTREWIEIAVSKKSLLLLGSGSPSYEGVDWNMPLT